MSSQKELKFTFPPPVPPPAELESKSKPPAYTPEAKKAPIVQVTEQPMEQGLNLTPSAQVGFIAGSLVAAAMLGKRAYNMYYSGEKKS